MNKARFDNGFTLIEMVITILLIGIVSAVAIARMLSADSFNAINVRESVISAVRIAQQKAIGHEDVVLTIQPDGDEVSITLVGAAGQLMPETRLGISSVSIAAEVDVLDACDATAPDAGNVLTDVKPLIIAFDALGDLITSGVVDGAPVYPIDVTTGLRICVNENPVMSVCVSAVGFAYGGDCDL